VKAAETASPNSAQRPLMQARDLKVHFTLRANFISSVVFGVPPRVVKAVDGVDLTVRAGEVVALAGESGCGKTTLGMTFVKMADPIAGELLFEGNDVAGIKGRAEVKRFRRAVQMVFQDPYSSLNPRLTIGESIREPLIVHRIGNRAEQDERVADALASVNIVPPQRFMDRFPHELSGGQRQRVAIARALVLEPKFIVADEPVSMLDVSVRAGVLELLRRLADSRNLGILYISHDLSTISHIADTLAVMYLGHIVEYGPAAAVIRSPMHPYTQALMAAVPVPDPAVRRPRVELSGEVPSPIDAPSGCPFRTRCPHVMDKCATVFPDFRERGPDHMVACYLYA
jgi:oligopeptide/dipeptide ABC transporter ATP-binding protein